MVEAAAYETRAVLQIASLWLLALVGEIYLDAMISLGTVGPVDGGVHGVVMVAASEDPDVGKLELRFTTINSPGVSIYFKT